MAIPIKLKVMKKDSLNATLNIHVDNIVLTTDVITFYGNLQYVPDYCSHIETLTPPPDVVTNGVPFTPVYRAIRQDGSPIDGIEAKAGATFTPEYPNKIKPSIINSIDPNATTTTASSAGVLIFTDFSFLQQPTGTIFFKAESKTDEGHDCMSDYAFLYVKPVVSEVELISPINQQLALFDLTVPLDTDQPTTIKLRD